MNGIFRISKPSSVLIILNMHVIFILSRQSSMLKNVVSAQGGLWFKQIRLMVDRNEEQFKQLCYKI